MTERRSGVLPLLLVVLLGAAAAAAMVVLGTSSSQALRVGAPAPDFSLQAISGAKLSLGELRGRVLFVNFWATWCPPCREEAPAMQRLYQDLANEPFEMLAISIDDAGADAAIESFRQEFGLSFPLLLDPQKLAYGTYQVYGVPETFLIDAQGRLAERFIGPKKWDDPRYERAIRRLIAAAAAGEARDG